MIDLHFSNSLDALFTDLSNRYADIRRRGHPFESIHGIVPNNDMGRWLQIGLAGRHGAMANVILEMPSSYMRMLYRKFDPDLEKRIADKDELSHLIFHILKQTEGGQQQLQPIFDYIHSGGEEETELRRWQMASRVADIFDQYNLYRPDWLHAWEQGRQPDECGRYSHAIWQKWLWRQICELFPGFVSRAGVQQQLKETIEAGAFDHELPEGLLIFATPQIPPVFLDTLMTIASRGTEIVWYHLKPAAQLVARPDFGDHHPLLVNFAGEQGESTACIEETITRHKVMCEREEMYRRPVGDSLLHYLQREIHDDQIPEDLTAVQEDGSLQIHSCHNPLREVEVLYDRILDYLNNNPERGTSDILVMVPDLPRYAPFLEAVFGTPDDEEQQLPYSLTNPDTGPTAEVARVFLSVLQVAGSKFRLTDILNVLDAPQLREQFGLTSDDISLLEKWAEETNIRWGWDEEHHNGVYQNSWRFGLDRMFAGLPWATNTLVDEFELLPYPEIEGGRPMHLLGTLRSFLEKLSNLRTFLASSHDSGEWVDRLSRVLDEFIPDNEVTVDAVLTIRQQISRFREIPEKWNLKQKLTYEIISEWLEASLSEMRLGQGFRNGNITISAMVPVRGMPFGFIGIPGMNEQDIPGRDGFMGFDLMGQIKRKGDRSRREQDRAIFLDTVMAAGEQLHLSYTGQDQKDNSEIPPSALVTELLDHLDNHYLVDDKTPSQRYPIRHPLYGFHPAYFDGRKPDYITYSLLKYRTAINERSAGTYWYAAEEAAPETGNEQIGELSLQELIRFLRRPVGHLLRETMNIYLPREEALSEDRDVWQLAGLSDYEVRSALLEGLLAGEDPGRIYHYFKAKGTLPQGAIGEYHFERLRDEVTGFLEELKSLELIHPYTEPLHIDITQDVQGYPFRIYGKLDHLTEQGNIFIRTGRLNARFKLAAWVYHLALQLSDANVASRRTVMAGRGESRPEIIQYEPVEQPRKYLAELLTIYSSGLRQPVPAYPKSASEFTEDWRKNQNEQKALRKAATALWGSSFSPYADRDDDPALDYVYSGFDPVGEQGYGQWAERIWEPILTHQKEGI